MDQALKIHEIFFNPLKFVPAQAHVPGPSAPDRGSAF